MMKTGEINIRESIYKMRLVESHSFFETILKFAGYVVTLGIFPFIFYITVRENNYRLSAFIVVQLIVIIILSIFVGYRFRQIWRLRKVEGLGVEENRKLLRQAAKNFSWNIEKDTRDIMVLVRPTIPFSLSQWDSGREIVILFDGKSLLLNSASFAKYNLKSPFHWIGNRNTENKLIDELKRLSEN